MDVVKKVIKNQKFKLLSIIDLNFNNNIIIKIQIMSTLSTEIINIIDTSIQTFIGKISSKYEEGVSCPRCHNKLSYAQKARFRMRQKQINLAKKAGKKHIFQKEI